MNYYGLGLAVLASILWGLTYCLDERVLSSLSVFKLYFLHCLCGVLVAGVIMLVQGASPASLLTFDTAKSSLPLNDKTGPKQPDWYFENGLLVYTAAYHLKRGFCCGSGCRHCPYEPRHIEGNTKVSS
jgi:hypothetical protein